MDNELLSRFFRMETTHEENLQIEKVARRSLMEQQKQMPRQGEWEQKVSGPANSIFSKLSMKNFGILPDSVKDLISKQVTDLKTAATEKNDQTAQSILLEARSRFEKAKIHPPVDFPYLDWTEIKK